MRRAKRAHTSSHRRHSVRTHIRTHASLLFSHATTLRELSSSRLTETSALSFSPFSRICFSNGANFRRYGSITSARSKRAAASGVLSTFRADPMASASLTRDGETVCGCTPIEYAYTAHIHTLFYSTKLSLRRVSIVAMIADRY